MFLANFYEFLATALDHGYLREDVLRDTFRQRICGFYERLRPYIDRVRKSNPRTYQKLSDLYARWQTAADSVEEA